MARIVLSAATDLDAVARGVRVVAWLLACPRGETCVELARRFGWSGRAVAGLLADLVPQGLVVRAGRRYRAAPDATTLAAPSGRRARVRRRAIERPSGAAGPRSR